MQLEDSKIGWVTRRMIGDVSIFDLVGVIKSSNINGICSYIRNYINAGKTRCGILNVQDVEFIDSNVIAEVSKSLSNLKKAVLYYENQDIADLFKSYPVVPFLKYFNRESQVVEMLGTELLNKRAILFFDEKRCSERISSAIATDMRISQKDSRATITSHGIISNLSAGGAYAECLDLESAKLIQQMDCFRSLDIVLSPTHTFYIQQSLQGTILRIEISGNHVALAIKFDQPIKMQPITNESSEIIS